MNGKCWHCGSVNHDTADHPGRYRGEALGKEVSQSEEFRTVDANSDCSNSPPELPAGHMWVMQGYCAFCGAYRKVDYGAEMKAAAKRWGKKDGE